MAKKPSALSRPAGLKRMTSDDIKNRKWSEEERQTLRRHAAKQAQGTTRTSTSRTFPA